MCVRNSKKAKYLLAVAGVSLELQTSGWEAESWGTDILCHFIAVRPACSVWPSTLTQSPYPCRQLYLFQFLALGMANMLLFLFCCGSDVLFTWYLEGLLNLEGPVMGWKSFRMEFDFIGYLTIFLREPWLRTSMSGAKWIMFIQVPRRLLSIAPLVSTYPWPSHTLWFYFASQYITV